MPSLFDRLLAQAQSKVPLERVRILSQGEDGTAGRTEYRRDQQAVLDALQGVATDWKSDRAARMDASVASTQDRLAAEKASALDAFRKQQEQLSESANRTMQEPVSGAFDIDVNALKPLQEITGVALNNTLTGGNAATDSFYVTPENTQSQFTVGAPVGGGMIGTRQRASTDDITSKPDRLGNRRKDQF